MRDYPIPGEFAGGDHICIAIVICVEEAEVKDPSEATDELIAEIH